MCMLSLITPEAEVNYEHLLNGAKRNTDGYGYAIVRHKGPNGLLVYKNMNRYATIERFREDRLANPGTYALFHSRWATGGVRDTTNCHPFTVGGDKTTVLGHNGIFSTLQPAAGSGDTRSDTAVFAEEIMPKRFRRLDRKGVQRQLAQAIGDYNKVAILTANPRYQMDAYLVNEKAGTWVEGVWHSNSDYKGWLAGGRYLSAWDDDYSYDPKTGYTEWKSEKTGKTYRWRERVAADDECPICYAKMVESVDLATGECQLCGFCVDCAEWFPDCSCLSSFSPAKHGLGPDKDTRAFVLTSKVERLALPPGSGSATKYGDGFDGEGDDEDSVMREPDDDTGCLYHPRTGWCESPTCHLMHRLAFDDDGEVATGIIVDGTEVIDPAEILADFDAAIDAGFDEVRESVTS